MLEKNINVKNKFIFLFVLIGDASYSIYLSHLYVIEFFHKIASDKLHLLKLYSFAGFTLSMIGSISVGYLIYRFIDLPCTKYFREKLNHFK